MRFIARVSALSAAALMTIGVASASAEPSNRFVFHAEQGASPVSGKSGDWALVNILRYDDILRIDGEGDNGFDYIRIELGAGTGSRLTIGRYENVRNLYRQPEGPGINVISDGLSCGDDYATVTVNDIERTASGRLTRFDADIEQRCGDPAGPALRAHVHYES